jgi:hypothetical protein
MIKKKDVEKYLEKETKCTVYFRVEVSLTDASMVAKFINLIRENFHGFVVEQNKGKNKVTESAFERRKNRQSAILVKIPVDKEIRIGELYRLTKRNYMNYKTLQRDLVTLALEGKILTRKINGGSEGRTTYVRRLM